MIHALRQLLKSPGFTLISVVTLALGIGLNTSMFSLMNLLLLQPVPFPDRDQLVRIYRTTPQTQTAGFNAVDFIEFSHAVRDVNQLGAFRPWGFTLAQADRPPVNLNAMRVSASFFPALGIKPELGRFFTVDEDKPGNHVIILSHATWQAQFGGDPTVVGRTVRVDGEPTTVIGVMSAPVSSVLLWGTPSDAFRPLAMTDAERVNKLDTGISLIARMNPGVALGQFNAQLQGIARHLAQGRPREQSQDGLRAITLQASARAPGTAGISWLLVGLAAFVLLIACGNLANLQLARAIMRSQEFAVRAALGATRLRLLQPLITESLLVSAAGGALGILVAAWADAWMSSRLSANGVVSFVVALDWHVLAFAIAISMVTGVLFGLVPGVVLSQIRVTDALKTGSRGNTGGRVHSRLRHGLIIAQFALALVLLAGAGLFISAFDRSLTSDIGWERHSLVQGVLSLPTAKYSTPEKLTSFYSALQDRLRVLPGVENVAVGWTLPMFTFLNNRNYVVEGRPAPPAGREPYAYVNGISPSYLATLKIKLLSGRAFADTDTLTSPPVVIINESMARALFPNESPIGHRLGTTDPANRGWAEIVGVIPDIRFALAFARPTTQFIVFKPLAQEAWGYVGFAVRGENAGAMGDSIRHAIGELDPDLPIQQFGTVDGLLNTNNGGIGMVKTLLTAFAALGLFLAAVGLYGVITRLVAQRVTEIGVRVALGAPSRDIVWLILRTGVMLTGIGSAIGLLGAFGLGKIMGSILPGLSMQNPLVICAVTGLLVVVALLASWIPAQRAARIDPLVALRSD